VSGRKRDGVLKRNFKGLKITKGDVATSEGQRRSKERIFLRSEWFSRRDYRNIDEVRTLIEGTWDA